MTTDTTLLLGIPACEWWKAAKEDTLWDTLTNIMAFQQKAEAFDNAGHHAEATEARQIVRLLQELVA